jgi:hypothetical protein
MSRWRISTTVPVVLIAVALMAAWRWGPGLGYRLIGDHGDVGALVGGFIVFLLVGLPTAIPFLTRRAFIAHVASGVATCLGFFSLLEGFFLLARRFSGRIYAEGSDGLIRFLVVVVVLMAAVLLGLSILFYIRLNRWLNVRWSAQRE